VSVSGQVEVATEPRQQAQTVDVVGEASMCVTVQLERCPVVTRSTVATRYHQRPVGLRRLDQHPLSEEPQSLQTQHTGALVHNLSYPVDTVV